MAKQHSFEEKGKVQPKPELEGDKPQKIEGPVPVSDMEGGLSPDVLTRMQKTVGNAAVQRFLAQRSADGSAEIEDETATAINSLRGRGQSLDESMSDRAGEVMNHDFSDVNVHTGNQADMLNRQLGSKAFTTGKDIFFKEGAYNPASSEGQELISHELTHVVQQSGNTSPGEGKMTVNDPNDQYEGEADRVAALVIDQQEGDLSQRQIVEPEEEEVQAQQEEEEDQLQMQEVPEEEEPALQAKLQRQVAEELGEEEEIQTQAEDQLQTQEVPEEEPELQAKLQRQDEREEELP